ncbi:nuclear transport factor 2 family protein [Streptomyces spinoverrucosus]|uniref:nuclear transport factor 2 family protein n=1 Tax=Streptomyces spinoverrucosus TaxID=284043 RepID=UPI0018C36CCF|nr:nuclear transport factor 2 family protein [Streptomyces spinoverrucosus]MBG0853867.1 nuclear transport factor 2 family protein [Streptomyces spinoverrucosus]
MHTVTDLLAANLHEVFGNRDPASRRAAIERIYTEDVVFTDPEGVTTGWDALEDKARALLDKVPPDFGFSEDGRRYAGAHDGALAWAFGPEGEPAVRGIDIITLREERIATVLTLFTA